MAASEHIAVITAVIYGGPTPLAILAIAAQVRRSRARHTPPPNRAWALCDVPTYLRRRRSGGNNAE